MNDTTLSVHKSSVRKNTEFLGWVGLQVEWRGGNGDDTFFLYCFGQFFFIFCLFKIFPVDKGKKRGGG